MSKHIRSVLLVALGVFLGLVVYDRFYHRDASTTDYEDSSFVRTALAADSSQQAFTHDHISETRQNAITRAVNKVSPAVVSVNVTKVREYIQRSPFRSDPLLRQFFPDFFRDRIYRIPVESIGSGFIFTEEGHILTNEHVVENAEEILVAMSNGQEKKAEIVGSDPVADVALLKIKGEALPHIKLGDSENLIIGEWAIALGNPFGLFVKSDPTVTVGVISALDRDFNREQGGGRVYQDMIQTDASINNGNSGGPLCNADGEVVGMNTFIYTSGANQSGSIGIGFAIPANRIKHIVEELKSKKAVDRNFWIGIYGSNLTPYLSRQLGFPSTDGALVKGIENKSPAKKAGLDVGDIILAIEEKRIKSFDEAQETIASMDLKVGDTLTITVWRDGKRFDVNLKLEKHPSRR